jgi:CheY-like chemotaxis protein
MNAPVLTGDILIADDSLINRKLLSHYLRQLGARVVQAHNGREAVEQGLLRVFDLILMDTQMPVMDGLSAIRQLRASGHTGPILVLTSDAMSEDVERCMQAGCDGFLARPFGREAFGNAVRPYLHWPGSASRDEPGSPLVSSVLKEDPGMGQLVQAFIERLPEMVTNIDAACAAADWAGLKSQVHNLKGIGGGYGFPQVTRVAAQIELVLARQDYAAVAAAIRSLRELEQRIQAGARARSGGPGQRPVSG